MPTKKLFVFGAPFAALFGDNNLSRSAGVGGGPEPNTAEAEPVTLQGVDELGQMDDWGSAWQEAKEKGEGWGGRGKGGRGIQRNTWQPKDVYVEGEGRL